jgi:hypothetical protein
VFTADRRPIRRSSTSSPRCDSGRPSHGRQGPPGRLPANCIIITTINLGAKQLQTNSSLGFRVQGERPARAEASYEFMREKVAAELKQNLRPEFLNRIDAIAVFRSFTAEEIRPWRPQSR